MKVAFLIFCGKNLASLIFFRKNLLCCSENLKFQSLTYESVTSAWNVLNFVKTIDKNAKPKLLFADLEGGKPFYVLIFIETFRIDVQRQGENEEIEAVESLGQNLGRIVDDFSLRNQGFHF